MAPKFKTTLTLVMASAAFAVTGCNKSSDSSPPPAATPAPSPYYGATNYPGAQFNPYNALNGMGTWQPIGGERYFVPQMNDHDRDAWVPYQNGYWQYDPGANMGWTFVSRDRWGWVTEHYGIWRHQERFGWIWLPFHDHVYQPSVVTWFDQGGYVGWYPFAPRYKALYVTGFGFNDGYWGGSFVNLGIGRNNFVFGFTLVERANVTQTNVAHFVIRDPGLVMNIAAQAHTEERIHQGLVGPHPGGSLDRSFEYIQGRATVQAPIGRAQTITSKGGAPITQPFAHPGGRDAGNERPIRTLPPTPRPPPQPAQPAQPSHQGSSSEHQAVPQHQAQPATPPPAHAHGEGQATAPNESEHPKDPRSTPHVRQENEDQQAPFAKPGSRWGTRPATQNSNENNGSPRNGSAQDATANPPQPQR